MQDKTEDGFKAVEAAKKENLNSKMRDQQQIVKLLLSAQKIRQVNQVNENVLLPSLKWLDRKAKTSANNDWTEADIRCFTTTSRDFYLHILAPAYLRQGDTTRAAMALLKSNVPGFGPLPDFWYNYLRPKQLQRIISWKKHQPKTPWLQFLTATLAYVDKEDLYELLGTAYLREHNYKLAVTAFAHLKNNDKRSTNQEEGDPFLDQLNDYPKTFSAPGKGYTKVDFAKAMAAL